MDFVSGGGVSGRPDTTVVVAVKHGASSRRAAFWVSEHLVSLCQHVVLVHVIPRVSFIPTPLGKMIPIDNMDREVVQMYTQDSIENAQDVFAPFKDLFRPRHVGTLVLEGDNPAETLVNYVSRTGTKNLVLGAANCYVRKITHSPDVAATVLRLPTNHCNVIVVAKAKLVMKFPPSGTDSNDGSEIESITHKAFCESEKSWIFREHFLRSVLPNNPPNQRVLSVGTRSFNDTGQSSRNNPFHETRSFRKTGYGPEAQEEVLKLRADLQRTLTLYNHVREDLAQAKKVIESLSIKCSEALQREAEMSRLLEMEKTKHLEATNQVREEIVYSRVESEKLDVMSDLETSGRRCRRYTKEEIEEATDNFSDSKKIGEGSYGDVYKCVLDETEVAVKVLRQDSNEKKEEFLKEVEILGQLQHPNMVLLLGFCPENGSLVYEYMQNGSLDDHLFLKNDETTPLAWQVRFRIIFEVACALAFLHNTRPDPIVHRDLKPGNILLDSNFKSKIGDVGLAKLISDVVPDGLTAYNETILAGTLYYMDPEYQRTGTVRPKSDVYALGVITLQMLTGRHPNGLLVRIEKAVESGLLPDLLDVSVPVWPVWESERLARLALRCCRLRCRDRPDLESDFLPEMEDILKRAHVGGFDSARQPVPIPPRHFVCPILKEIMEDPYIAGDGYTYEHKAIEAWLNKSDFSPITRHKLKHTSIIPNHSLRSAIKEWKSSVQIF